MLESEHQEFISRWLQDVATRADAAIPEARCISEPHSGHRWTSPISPPQSTTTISKQRKHRRPHGVKRKRRRSMSEDALSQSGTVASSVPSSALSSRPILTPKAPSSRQAQQRSPSPTRKQLTLLAMARPAIVCCQPSHEVRQPEMVSRLRKHLVAGRDRGFIPGVLKEEVRLADPSEFEDIDDECFDQNEDDHGEDARLLWRGVQSIHKEARECRKYHKDENAWVEVVKNVLRVAGSSSRWTKIEVNSIQTQQIDPRYLPTLPNSLTPFSKKADVALGLGASHPAIDTLRRSTKPGATLSQMRDAYTSTIPLACGIEVKETGGDYNEAVMQLGVWTAAGLGKLEEMAAEGAGKGQGEAEGVEREVIPMIGWTVLGHEWKLHLSWKKDGLVIACGPWTKLSAGTGSYEEIFRLLDLLRRVGEWVEVVHWGWLVDVLELEL